MKGNDEDDENGNSQTISFSSVVYTSRLPWT